MLESALQGEAGKDYISLVATDNRRGGRVGEKFPLECPACGSDIRLRGDGRQEPAHFEPEVCVCGRHGRHAACGRHARPFRNGRRKRPVAAESQTQKNIPDTLDTTVIASFTARQASIFLYQEATASTHHRRDEKSLADGNLTGSSVQAICL